MEKNMENGMGTGFMTCGSNYQYHVEVYLRYPLHACTKESKPYSILGDPRDVDGLHNKYHSVPLKEYLGTCLQVDLQCFGGVIRI